MKSDTLFLPKKIPHGLFKSKSPHIKKNKLLDIFNNTKIILESSIKLFSLDLGLLVSQNVCDSVQYQSVRGSRPK